MATDGYWERRQAFLLDPEIGALASLPMSAEALVAFGPGSALENALAFLVLDRRQEAMACLEFVPRLQPFLSNPGALQGLPDHRIREAAAHLRRYLHLGVWLRTGEMEPTLADDAYAHLLALNQWWGKRFTGPNLHDLMLLSIEGGRQERAGELYLQHERRPLHLPPKDLRFSSNARALLHACLAAPADATRSLLQRAVEAFRQRASRWERSVSPVPYVMPIDLVRTLRACNLLLGSDYALGTVVRLIR
jgi:hypothetical protein